MIENKKVIIIMPAYNAEKTLEHTYQDIPKDWVDEIILVDDASHDRTVSIAKKLGIKVIARSVNSGYGANQKTCYLEALKHGVDIVVMIHPDNQYDATKLPKMVAPFLKGEADVVLGSRILGEGALKGGMPVWKYIANKFLTWCENKAFGRHLSEYHTGLRAYSRRVLDEVAWYENSNDFVFDTEIVAQCVNRGYCIKEIGIPTRYFKEASRINFKNSCIYGLKTLNTLRKYLFYKWGWKKYSLFKVSKQISLKPTPVPAEEVALYGQQI